MDLIGKNDPFVVFRAGEESKQTTVAKSTQNYDYLNEEYELLYYPSVMQGKHEIEVEVYDYDSITKNDLIGVTNIDV
jgi:Ca2+-dependent lipid-binding protein